MQSNQSHSVAFRQMVRRGMVLPSGQAGAAAGVELRPPSRAGRLASGWDTAALMSLCLRISLVFWTGLIAGVALSWHYAIVSGGFDGLSGTAYVFEVSQDPVFRAIFFGSLLLHTVLAVEGGLRWEELHAKVGFLAACAFLLFAKIERSLPFADPAAGEPTALDGAVAMATDWGLLSGLMAAAATISFLLVIMSLSVGRPAITARR